LDPHSHPSQKPKTKKIKNKKTLKINPKKVPNKWDPLLEAPIPELFEYSQSDLCFFSYERTNNFTVNATTLYIYICEMIAVHFFGRVGFLGIFNFDLQVTTTILFKKNVIY
jgi:hypothetical protein